MKVAATFSRTDAPPRLAEDDTPRLSSVTVVVASAPSDPGRLRRVRSFIHRNRTTVLFVALLFVTDWTIGRFAGVWDRHSPDDYATRVNACAREPRDVVFLGGSPVAEGIDPDRIAGVPWGGRPAASVYALGLSGGTTSDFYHAVLRGCPTPPRLIVYGMTASDVNDSRHEPHGPYSLMTWGDLVRWVRLRPESTEWVTRHFVLARIGQASNVFRYRHGIRMWAATEADRQMPGSCPEAIREADELRERADTLLAGSGYAPARGFAIGRYDQVKAAGLKKEFPYLRKYRTGSHLKYLDRLIGWCNEREVELVLIDMPVTADLEATYSAEFAEYRSRLQEIERGRAVRVVRASREAVGLNDAHFADLIHMNRDGAQVFSEWVRRQLEAIGHRPR